MMRRAFLTALVFLCHFSPCFGQTVLSPFNTNYSIVDLGPAFGVPEKYGGVTFLGPDVDTRRTFVSNLQAEGLAVDPLTGDFIASYHTDLNPLKAHGLIVVRRSTRPSPTNAVVAAATPNVITNDYGGSLRLQITGLPAGQELRVESYFDLNGNGEVNTDDPPVQSFAVTDGAWEAIAGVRNLNLPFDADLAANGQVVIDLELTRDYAIDHVPGRYLYRISDSAGRLAPVITSVTVLPKIYPQGVTGTLRDASTKLPIVGGLVLLFDGERNQQVASSFTDTSGRFTLYAPPGGYVLFPLKRGYKTSLSAADLAEALKLLVSIQPSVVLEQNLTLAAASQVISGKIADSNTGAGLPGLFLYGASATNELFSLGIAFTESTGAFNMSVTPGFWALTLPQAALARLGYLSLITAPPVLVGTNAITETNLQLPKATALIYGTVENERGEPLTGVPLNAMDLTRGYATVARTDVKGNYTLGVSAGTWQITTDPKTTDALGYGSIDLSVSLTNAMAVARKIVLKPIPAPAPETARWRWRNPQPQGNTLRSLAFGNGKIVIIGDGGAILSSPDGHNWNISNSGTESYLRSVAYSSGSFVAVGSGGTILTSPDGTAWTLRSSGTDETLESVASGNGAFVVVGGALEGKILTSTDTLNWRTTYTATNDSFMAVVFGAGKFVAVGFNGTILTSTNGTDWSRAKSPTTSFLSGIAWGNGLFVAVGEGGRTLGDSNTILTSSDGLNWTKQTSGVSSGLYAVTYSNGLFVAVGFNGAVLSSTDGTRWSQRDSGTSKQLYGVGFGSNRYFAAGEDGTILSSFDGIDWVPQSSGNTSSLSSIAYGKGIFVAVSDSGSVFSSSDGLDWVERLTLFNQKLNGVVYGQGRFVAVGELGRIWTSMDAINWVPSSSFFGAFKAVTYGNGVFVAVGDSGAIASSIDGSHWKSAKFGDRTLVGVAHGNGIFVIIELTGGSWTSADGANWTKHDAGDVTLLSAVTFGNQSFVAVGASGKVFTSSDGVAWTWRDSMAGEALNGIAYGNGNYVAVGGNGVISASADGIHWARRVSGTANRLAGVAYGGGTFVVIGQQGNILQSDPLPVLTPIVTHSPASQTVAIGGTVTFQISAGPGSVAYQWRKNGIPIPGATSSALTLRDVQVKDEGEYMVLVTNQAGAEVSAPGFLAVERPQPPLLDRWLRRSVPPLPTLFSVTFGRSTQIFEGVFVAVGEKGTIIRSTDGSTWFTSGSGSSEPLFGVGFGSNVFVAVGGETTGSIFTSDTGITWTARNSGTTNSLLAVAFGNDRFVIVGDNGAILTSTNGVTWTQQSSRTAVLLYSVAFGNGIFVATGEEGTLLTSPNGIDWTRQASGTTETICAVGFGGNRFVAAGEKGVLLNSLDGLAWQPQLSGSTNTLWSVAYGNRVFLVTGENGSLSSSVNGQTWTRHASGTTNILYGASYGNGAFVVVDSAGTVMQSEAFAVLGVKSEGGIELSISGGRNRAYRIEYAEELQALTPWKWLTEVFAPDTLFRVRDPEASGATQRFYRAVVLP